MFLGILMFFPREHSRAKESTARAWSGVRAWPGMLTLPGFCGGSGLWVLSSHQEEPTLSIQYLISHRKVYVDKKIFIVFARSLEPLALGSDREVDSGRDGNWKQKGAARRGDR